MFVFIAVNRFVSILVQNLTLIADLEDLNNANDVQGKKMFHFSI